MRLPNSYGSIVRLSGNRRRPYAVRITTGWTDEGKQIQKYLGYYAKRAEAIAALAEYNQSPFDLANQKLTFADMYDRWISSTSPLPPYHATAFKHLSPLHSMPFLDIRRRHIQSVFDQSGLGYSTLGHMKSLCSLIYKYAIDLEIVSVNQVSGLKMPEKEPSQLHQPFTDEEIATLWAHADTDPASMYNLMLIYTGCRPTELLTIRTENVNLDEKYMRGGIKTAASKNRIIPLADKILPFIHRLYDPSAEYLCRGSKAPHLTYKELRKICATSPVLSTLPHSHLPHDGRHTCASLLDRAGVNLKTMQLILGHSSKSITLGVYTHKTISDLLAAINSI